MVEVVGRGAPLKPSGRLWRGENTVRDKEDGKEEAHLVDFGTSPWWMATGNHRSRAGGRGGEGQQTVRVALGSGLGARTKNKNIRWTKRVEI